MHDLAANGCMLELRLLKREVRAWHAKGGEFFVRELGAVCELRGSFCANSGTTERSSESDAV